MYDRHNDGKDRSLPSSSDSPSLEIRMRQVSRNEVAVTFPEGFDDCSLGGRNVAGGAEHTVSVPVEVSCGDLFINLRENHQLSDACMSDSGKAN